MAVFPYLDLAIETADPPLNAIIGSQDMHL
jgi:hypothetical protein